MRSSAAFPTGSRTWISSWRRSIPHAENGVAISPKGITALENILFSKYLMYKTVYWHKTVRIATAMIKKAIAMALDAGGHQARRTSTGWTTSSSPPAFTAEVFPGFALIEDTRHRSCTSRSCGCLFGIDTPPTGRWSDIGARLPLERRSRARPGPRWEATVRPECIIVDVPERLSFEAAIPVIDPGARRSPRSGDGRPGRRVSHGMGHGDFPGSLRSISVSAQRDPELLAVLARMDLASTARHERDAHCRRIARLLERFANHVGRGINRFAMIGPGTGSSSAFPGGRTRWRLSLALAERRKWVPVDYELSAVQVEWREYPMTDEENGRHRRVLPAARDPFPPVAACIAPAKLQEEVQLLHLLAKPQADPLR